MSDSFFSSPSYSTSTHLSGYHSDPYQRFPQFKAPLLQFIAQFGIIDLGSLSPQQAQMLLVAKNGLPIISRLSIPEALPESPAGEITWTRQKTSRMVPRHLLPADQESSAAGANIREVEFARGPEDLPDLLPSEWLLHEIAPDIFFRDLLGGKLLRQNFDAPEPEPDELVRIEADELVPTAARSTRSNQFAYALFDHSESMDSDDGRGVASRGLLLAYLLCGWLKESSVYCIPFTTQIEKTLGGQTFSDFSDCVRCLLETKNEGSTNIQQALTQLATQAPPGSARQRVDIALFTDGVSKLVGDSPLKQAYLHSFLLHPKVLPLIDPQEVDDDLTNPVIKLRQWSSSMFQFSNAEYTQLLIPTAEDRQWISTWVTELPDRFARALSQKEFDLLDQSMKNVAHLLDEALRLGNGSLLENDREELKSLQAKLKKTAGDCGNLDRNAILEKNLDALPISERERLAREAQTAAAMAKANGQSPSSANAKGLTVSDEPWNPLQSLMQLVRKIGRLVRQLKPHHRKENNRQF